MVSLIFLEGPAYAGKTTFLNDQDTEKALVLAEASEFLGGDHNFPEAPHDIKSMLHCTYFFSFMENLRLSNIDSLRAQNKTTVFADRFTPLSSMMFYYLRHRAGAISAEDYVLGIQLCSKVFRDNLRLPAEPFGHKFLLFGISDQAEFTKRLSRGTRNTDFNSWENFQLLSDKYRQLLPEGTEEVTNGRHTPQKRASRITDRQALLRTLEPEKFIPDELSVTPLGDHELAEIITSHISNREISAIKNQVKEFAQ